MSMFVCLFYSHTVSGIKNGYLVTWRVKTWNFRLHLILVAMRKEPVSQLLHRVNEALVPPGLSLIPKFSSC